MLSLGKITCVEEVKDDRTNVCVPMMDPYSPLQGRYRLRLSVPRRDNTFSDGERVAKTRFEVTKSPSFWSWEGFVWFFFFFFFLNIYIYLSKRPLLSAP